MTKPITTRVTQRAPLVDRVFDRIEIDGNGCWLYRGALTGAGYGQVCVNYVRIKTHRFMWETHVGPIPDGLQLDHLCRVRACCNPEHLEPVTGRQNVLRSPIAPPAVNARKTHCPQAHSYADPTVLYVDRTGRRHCRICRNALNRTRRAAA